MLKKIDQFKINVNKFACLICPICGEQLTDQNNSLVCSNMHTFDIAKQGYATLIKNKKLPLDSHYDDKLFSSRKFVIEQNFFKPVEDYVKSIVTNKKLVLDLGSGDGKIAKRIFDDTNLILFDLNKDAIKMATENLNKFWLPIVGDLNFLPIANNSVDLILNFLSPINPIEASRALNDDGVIIKVIPTKNYLKEFREAINKPYDNVVEENLKNNFDILSKKTISYNVELESELLKNLIYMTPLMANNREILSLSSITVELDVLEIKPKK